MDDAMFARNLGAIAALVLFVATNAFSASINVGTRLITHGQTYDPYSRFIHDWSYNLSVHGDKNSATARRVENISGTTTISDYDYGGNWSERVNEENRAHYDQSGPYNPIPDWVLFGKSAGIAGANLSSGSLAVSATTFSDDVNVNSGDIHFSSQYTKSWSGASFNETIYRSNSDNASTVSLDLNLHGKLYAGGNSSDASIKWEIIMASGSNYLRYIFQDSIANGEERKLFGSHLLDTLHFTLNPGDSYLEIYSSMIATSNSYLGGTETPTFAGAEFDSTSWMNLSFSNGESFTSSSGQFLTNPRANIGSGEVSIGGTLAMFSSGLMALMAVLRRRKQ